MIKDPISARLPWSPLSLPRGHKLASRVLMAPLTTDSANEDGTVSAGELAFLRRRVSPLLGAVITSAAYVDPAGKSWQSIGAASRAHLASLTLIADTIHAAGTKAILQVYDGGRLADLRLIRGQQPRAPSAIPSTRPGAVTPRPMLDDEIDAVIRGFANATRLACEAGFDGVELHGANHYLVQQFLSPRSNRRAAPWGGSPAARQRFALEVLKAIRTAAGGAIVGYRLMPWEYDDAQNRITAESAAHLADLVVDEGIDYIHVAFDNFFVGTPYLEDRLAMSFERATVRTISQDHPIHSILSAIRGRVVTVAAGDVESSEDLTAILKLGVDAVAVGRAIIVDPDWPTKVTRNDEASIITRLPVNEDGLAALDIPPRMRRYILSRPDWFLTTPELQTQRAAR
jgi:2,4-dienoyl-CoA reductase-like NADH-dependent reductase (Old Yellow Enzyme family)